MSPMQAVCAVLVPLVWGTQYVVIRIGLTAFPPLFFVVLRFAVIAAMLLPFVARTTRRELVCTAVISVFIGGLNFGLTFVGLMHTPAGVAGIANQLWTPFMLLLAWPLLAERPSLRAVSGVLIAFGGVALAIFNPATPVPFAPTLLIVGAAAALAAGSVLSKRYGPFDPLKLMAWMSLFTVPQVLAVSLLTEHGQLRSLAAANTGAWLALCYTILIGGIAGFGMWFWLVSRCSMARVAPFTLLQSPFAIAAGVMFGHEPLTPALAVGAVICITGVAITQRSPRSEEAPPQQDTRRMYREKLSLRPARRQP